MFAGTVIVWMTTEPGLRVMRRCVYLYVQPLALDVFGPLALIGLLMAFYRGFFFKPERLENTWRDAVTAFSPSARSTIPPGGIFLLYDCMTV